MSGRSRLYRYYVEHSLDDLHLAGVGIAAVLYLIYRFSRNDVYANAGTCLLCITILSFLVHRNQRRLDQYITINDKVSFLPERQIRTMNNLFLGAYGLITGAVMVIIIRSPYRTVGNFLIALFKAVLGTILRIFFRNSSAKGIRETFLKDVNLKDVDLTNADNSGYSMLEKIMGIIATTAIIIFAVVVLISLVNFIYRKLTGISGSADTDVHEFIRPEMKSERIDASSAAGSEVSDNSINMRIRKVYKKRIRRAARSSDDNRKVVSRNMYAMSCSTPSEIEEHVHIDMNTESNQALHRIYEQARYSENGCNENDLRSVR